MTEETPKIERNNEEPTTPPVEDAPESEADVLFLSPDDSEVVPAEALAAETAGLKEQIEAVEAERDDFKNRMIRAAADLENFRKRSNREKDELRRYGIDKVVGELIPVVDNFDRALQHTELSEENKSLIEGIQMIFRQFVSALAKHGVEGFESVGEPFDPTRHEAIQQVETDEYDAGTVVDQFQKGYFLHDRLIRPALVSVSKKPTEVAEVAEDDPSEAETVERDVLEAAGPDDSTMEHSPETPSTETEAPEEEGDA